MYTVCVGVVAMVGYYSAVLDPVFPTTCAAHGFECSCAWLLT